MAPTDRKTTSNKFTGKDGNWKKSNSNVQGVKKKKWTPDHKVFEGSVSEGQGFAFKRKEKVRHEYNKLLRKEKRRNPESKQLYQEEYPEHLRHLYQAEAQKLKQEAWTNRVNRSKLRNFLPMSNRMRKKMQKKTSYQKTKEEFETIKEKQRQKKGEFLKNKQQREEAIQKYKQKKLETFQILSKKTKKGQPNLNLQMEYLLQKIQRTEK
ncbi:thyroid transcription factor 1-associated protein 26 homolog [Hippoglossus hippoglossus]|uniref:thyroid transcription factor 1-associated protein 26 homolog n=1 Tax=Hippoglossus hippoglossus TaxID=8267 RepID=UPI00148D3F23|nr:thyroid transcription factor 1-associated protein 26 homolog [Hippoglossus hippoglossus]